MAKFKVRLGPRKGVERIPEKEKKKRIRETIGNSSLTATDIANRIRLDRSGVKKLLDLMPEVGSEEVPIPADEIRSFQKTKKVYFLKNNCPSQT